MCACCKTHDCQLPERTLHLISLVDKFKSRNTSDTFSFRLCFFAVHLAAYLRPNPSCGDGQSSLGNCSCIVSPQRLVHEIMPHSSSGLSVSQQSASSFHHSLAARPNTRPPLPPSRQQFSKRFSTRTRRAALQTKKIQAVQAGEQHSRCIQSATERQGKGARAGRGRAGGRGRQGGREPRNTKP